MMAYFLIEAGIVVQKQPNDDDGFIEGPDDVFCGYLFDGEEFAPPAASPLDALKAELTAGINSHVAALLATGAPVVVGESTLHVALDDGSRADLTAMAATAIAASGEAIPWPASYQAGWIAIENVRIPLPTPSHGLGLAAGVGDRYAQIRQHGRDLKDAVIAAIDEVDLAALDIETGWP